MSRILLADDSPHAQRMGERILREEGFEVVSLTDGETALLRMADADPDVILADAFLPGKSGLEICRYVKNHPRHRHVRVVMTAGLLEPLDEEEAARAGCDGILKKPFEASVLVRTIKPLVGEAKLARGKFTSSPQLAIDAPQTPFAHAPVEPRKPLASVKAPMVRTASEAVQTEAASSPAVPVSAPTLAIPVPEVAAVQPAPPVELDSERIQAAVTLALDAAMPELVREITERVKIALQR